MSTGKMVSANVGAKRIIISANLPESFDTAALQNLNADIAKAMHGAKATDVEFNFSYPWGGSTPTKTKDGQNERVGRGRDDEDGTAEDEAPKRRGRPRKSAEDADDGDDEQPARRRRRAADDGDDAEEARTQTRRRVRRSRTEADEDAGGNEPERASEDDEESGGKGAGRRRSSGGSAGSRRGTGKPVRVEQPADEDDEEWGDDEDGEEEDADEDGEDVYTDEEMTANGEEWNAKTPGDEWPDGLTPKKVDDAVLKRLMAEHHEATGQEARKATFDVMENVAGTRKLSEVKPAAYRKLAKALLKDTARYTYGVKKSAAKKG